MEYLTREFLRNIRTIKCRIKDSDYQTIGYRTDTNTIGCHCQGTAPETYIYVPGVLGVLFLAFNKVAEAGEEQAC